MHRVGKREVHTQKCVRLTISRSEERYRALTEASVQRDKTSRQPIR